MSHPPLALWFKGTALASGATGPSRQPWAAGASQESSPGTGKAVATDFSCLKKCPSPSAPLTWRLRGTSGPGSDLWTRTELGKEMREFRTASRVL